MTTLWILATSASKPLLADFGAVARPDWQSGIYWLPAAQRTAIVSIDELPITPDTLTLRILGRGKTQQQAIAEVRSLNQTDPQRSQVLRILANWKVSLERNDELAADDREVIMALS